MTFKGPFQPKLFYNSVLRNSHVSAAQSEAELAGFEVHSVWDQHLTQGTAYTQETSGH